MASIQQMLFLKGIPSQNTPIQYYESLVQIIDILGKKLTGKRKNLEVDEDDIVEDAVAY